MPLTILIGAQWGDEGKGRIVDLLSAKADYVARFNGGDNAGHSVTVGEHLFKLHLIPSGIIHPSVHALIGNGVVLNPDTFLDEVASLAKAGIEVNPERLKISYGAHLITPAHKALDRAQELARGKDSIGTTGRGIGPVYTDKVRRHGLRVGNLLDLNKFEAALRADFEAQNYQLRALYNAEPLSIEENVARYIAQAKQLIPFIADCGLIAHDALRAGKHLLAEGAQGTLLDLDYGSYPFVTSSTTCATGAFAGLGVGIQTVSEVVGAVKAFQTRVGAGPFPTELFGEEAARLRGDGSNPWDEYGTTTGRPRRVGWLDLVLLRYAIRINGISALALTKLDVLSGLEEIRFANSYQFKGRNYSELPYGTDGLEKFSPLYESLPGWQEEISCIRHWEDLPKAAQVYVQTIEQLCKVPVRWISVGPERDQVIYR